MLVACCPKTLGLLIACVLPEFRLLSRQPIRIISLLPPKEDTRTVL